MVEIILTQEILKLGSKGDIVKVANGYARNYLFPKQLAIPATAANKRQVEEMKAAADREAASLRGDAEKLAEALSGVILKIVARAGEADQLFGSVTSRDIAAELEKLGYTVDRHKILIERPIRMVGEHEATVHLHRDIDIPLKIRVLAEGREEEPAEAEQEAAEEETAEAASAEASAEETSPAEEPPPSKSSSSGKPAEEAEPEPAKDDKSK